MGLKDTYTKALGKTFGGKSMKPGGGGSFAKGVASMEGRGIPKDEAGAIMAKAGRKKYGAAKMAAWSKAGRRRAEG